jgi:mycoredoxin
VSVGAISPRAVAASSIASWQCTRRDGKVRGLEWVAPAVTEPDGTPQIEFYWRPGCPFCSMLERSLGRRQLPLRRINIWEDPAAAATVREVARGNETVPTVIVAGHALVNPSGRQVEELVARVAPGLLPGT